MRVITLLAVMSLTACREPPPLRVGLNAWPGYEFLFLAEQIGAFQETGRPVKLVEFTSLSDARRAYERGQIDGLGTTVVEVMQAREIRDRSLQIVRVVDASMGADRILARTSHPDVKSLAGARVGVEFASLGVYVLGRALERAGLGLQDVQIVSSNQATMKDQFARAQLDAIVTYPPFSLELMKAPDTRTLFSTAEIPGEVVDVLAFDATLVKERPDDIARLLTAFDRAMEYYGQHPARASAIMAAREGISAREFEGTLENGIELFSARQQQDFLSATRGSIQQVVDATDRLLRRTAQVRGPDRREGAFTDRFAGTP